MEDMNLDELDELEDDEEERILEQYRRQRMAQIKELQAKSVYGDVRDISADDYVAQVSQMLLHLRVNPTKLSFYLFFDFCCYA